jgi:hypothetical protein
MFYRSILLNKKAFSDVVVGDRIVVFVLKSSDNAASMVRGEEAKARGRTIGLPAEEGLAFEKIRKPIRVICPH